MITLRNRVNELGVSEPIVRQQGIDRISVELPGVLEFRRSEGHPRQDRARWNSG